VRTYLDLEGVAAKLSLTRHQVYKLCRRPTDPLPHRKLGKCLRFDDKSVDRWFDRQPGRDGEDIGI
jgi:predicted DNA-binding transcriptional regulator AlpA